MVSVVDNSVACRYNVFHCSSDIAESLGKFYKSLIKYKYDLKLANIRPSINKQTDEGQTRCNYQVIKDLKPGEVRGVRGIFKMTNINMNR